MNVPTPILLSITDFGDSAVLSFGTLGTCAVLLLGGEKRAALRLFFTVATAAATIALAKIYFLGCGSSFTFAHSLYSPSGHAAITTAFCTAIAAYLSMRRQLATRVFIWLVAGGIITMIAGSRVMLAYHSKIEVYIGFAIGFFSFALIQRLISVNEIPKTIDPIRRATLVAALLIIFIALHGHRLPAERVIRAIAHHLPDYFPGCIAV